MNAILYTIGAWVMASLVARLLISAGITITYYVVLATLANEFVDLLEAQIALIPSVPYNLLGIAGVWQGLGYVLSAILARITIQATMVRLTRAEA